MIAIAIGSSRLGAPAARPSPPDGHYLVLNVALMIRSPDQYSS